MTNGNMPSSAFPARPAAGPQGTQLLSAEELQQYARVDAAETDGRASVHEPVLMGSNGSVLDKRFVLKSGRQTLGRRHDNNIVIDDPSVSAAHAWIINQNGHYVVMNTLSTNGTYVNGKRIHEAPLQHGDRVHFGQAEFVFLTREHDESAGRSRRWQIAFAFGGVLVAAVMAYWLI